MKIDFSAAIKDYKGNVIALPQGGSDDKMTLGFVSMQALDAVFNDEPGLPAQDKVRRFKLALRASEGGEQDLSPEDVAEIRKVVSKAYGPLIVGRVHEMTEGSADQAKT